MVASRFVRFKASKDADLSSFVAHHPGLSHSSDAALLVGEGLGMDAYPGVLFRQDPAGRRAVPSGGPDVWEAVRAIKSAKASEPDMAAGQLLALVSEGTGLPERLLSAAIA